MIEFVFASASILADWGSWIALGLLLWVLAGAVVAALVCRHLAGIPDQYPPAAEEEVTAGE